MKGKMKCPICHGSGTVTENTEEYQFETRDPITSRCLVCDGSGYISPRKKLPDGRTVCDLDKAAPAAKKPRLKAEREAVIPRLWSKEMTNAFSEAFRDVARQEVTVKVTVLYISGSRSEVMDMIQGII